MPGADTTESIEVGEFERIVPGGSESARWYVKVGDGWVRASEHPTAERTRVDAGPGVVWETRIALRLPREFLRVGAGQPGRFPRTDELESRGHLRP